MFYNQYPYNMFIRNSIVGYMKQQAVIEAQLDLDF